MTQFTVRLFARYAEVFGTDAISLELPEPARISDLVDALRLLPGGVALPDLPFVAVNMKQARSESALRAGDEVALLPPLAGG